MQDYIAMVLIWYATQPQADILNDVSRKEFTEALEKIDQQLDAVMMDSEQ